MAKREVLTPFPYHEDADGDAYPNTALVPEPRGGRPWNPMEALMQAVPLEEPETSQLELLALRDILADALDDLAPRDRRLIEARIIERRSLRSLERELGWRKSHMQRRERVLLAQLAAQLSTIPAIQEYLTRND